MDNKKVSIIVPVYNVELFIKRCVDSILEQTYTEFEVLLIDDGSTDKSGEICDNYLKIDERIKCYHKENGGLSDARNYGMKCATGEYYTFIDSDDYIGRDYLKILMELITENSADMSIINLKVTHDLERLYSADVEEKRMVFSSEEALKIVCLNTYFGVSACGKMYHCSVFDSIKYPKGMLYEDLLTTPYLIAKCKKIAFSTSTQYYWYQRAGSITHGEITEKYLVLFDGLRKLVDFVDEKYPNLHDAAICRYVNDSFWSLIQKLVFCNSYYDLIDRIIKENKKYWIESLKNPYISFRKKINVVLLLLSKRLYRALYLTYKKNKF